MAQGRGHTASELVTVVRVCRVFLRSFDRCRYLVAVRLVCETANGDGERLESAERIRIVQAELVYSVASEL